MKYRSRYDRMRRLILRAITIVNRDMMDHHPPVDESAYRKRRRFLDEARRELGRPRAIRKSK